MLKYSKIWSDISLVIFVIYNIVIFVIYNQIYQWYNTDIWTGGYLASDPLNKVSDNSQGSASAETTYRKKKWHMIINTFNLPTCTM